MSWIAGALLLVLLAALLTAAATAVRSVSRIWLRHWAEQCVTGSGAAALYLERPQRLLLAAAAGVVACAALLGALVAARVGWTVLLAPALVVAAAVLLLVGQLLPHAVARRWPARLVPPLLPLLRGAAALVAPAYPLGRLAARRWRSETQRSDADVARDDLEELLRDSELEGIGERAENTIIAGVVRFGETRVGDVMTPREAIVAADVDLPRPALVQLVAQSGYSRVPLVRGSLDDVVGMVHVFDLLDGGRGAPMEVRPAAWAEADQPCSALLVQMLGRRRHLAVVRSASGATVGLVTLEDLLEALVGDIRDEHDEPPAPAAA